MARNLKMGDFGIAKVLACTIAVAKTQIGTSVPRVPSRFKAEALLLESGAMSREAGALGFGPRSKPRMAEYGENRP